MASVVAESQIPFADDAENNNNEKTNTEGVNQHIPDITLSQPSNSTTVQTTVEDKPVNQTVAEIHNQNPEENYQTQSANQSLNETASEQDKPECDKLTIQPTLNVSQLSLPNLDSGNFVRAAGGPPSNHLPDSINSEQDIPDSLPVSTESVKYKPLPGSEIKNDTGPLTQRGAKERVLIPAGKPKTEKKKRFSSFRKWITCTHTEKEFHSREAGDSHKVTASSRQASQLNIVKIENILDSFIHYNHSTQEAGRPHGRGLCVIFTLFTGELKGYYHDRNRAAQFFNEKLGYDVFCQGREFVDCTQAQLKSSMRQVQMHITYRARQNGSNYYDRFVLIILTHGEKDGLMACADRGGVKEERRQVLKNGKWQSERVLTKIEDIVAFFKHDEVPELKDKPKMFLIQACRGADVLRSAGTGDSVDHVERPQYDLSNLSLRPEVPIDADVLVLYATTPDHESWVSPSDGSWFIQKSLDVFERHYKNHAVEDMMTVINFVIAEERGQCLQSNGKPMEVVQMPCKFSTLRMKFYL